MATPTANDNKVRSKLTQIRALAEKLLPLTIEVGNTNFYRGTSYDKDAYEDPLASLSYHARELMNELRKLPK